MLGRIIPAFFNIALAYLMWQVLFRERVANSFVQATNGIKDYLSYIVIGVSVYVFVHGILLNVGRSLIAEQREGTLRGFLMSFASRSAFLLGNLMGQALVGIPDFVAIAFIGFLFGANFGEVHLFSLLLMIPVTLFAAFSMALVLNLITLYMQDTFVTQNTLFATIYLLCGVLFPVNYFPEMIQRFVWLIPLTSNLWIIRQISIRGASFVDMWRELGFLIALSSLYFLIGMILLERVTKKAAEISA